MSNIIFITKDALNKHILPTYGNQYWQTPNIDELAQKGTVFCRHYTAAASTAMSFTSMSIGKYCYETERRKYSNESSMNGDTLFDKIAANGYECHIIWDESYTVFAESHFRCEGVDTQIHGLIGLKQEETIHNKGEFDDMSFDDDETKKAIELIKKEMERIKENAKKKIFIWMHLPHIMRGRQGYGSDIDVLDKIVGIARVLFEDEDIFISADHGHMNGWKNKYHYGYDVEEEAICIPMIGPKINGSDFISFPTSNIQMYDILYERKVSPLDIVISETAYYAQPKRKIAIIRGKYKYCYDKECKREFLYDLEFDPQENHNLVYPEFYDTDRFLWYSTAQCFYYPNWHDAHKTLAELRKEKDIIWRNGSMLEEFVNKILHRVKCLYTRIQLAHPDKVIKNIGK